MAEIVTGPGELYKAADGRRLQSGTGETSLGEIWAAVIRNWRLFLSVFAVLIAPCLTYCLIAPSEYESTGKVELRGSPDSPAIERRDAAPAASFAASQIQLETLANVLRSEQLAWDVITKLRLYTVREFSKEIQGSSGFSPDSPSPIAKDHLLRRFRENLVVESLPHTLVLVIRFRSHDAALSAGVVNELVSSYLRQETASRMQATRGQTDWLNVQLRGMKVEIEHDDEKLAAFQSTHGILSVPGTSVGAGPLEVSATGTLTAIEALSRELTEATADRLLRESEYKAAVAGDPEMAVMGDLKDGFAGSSERTLLQQLHARRSDLELEQARLEVEHGPNYPRLTEIHKQSADVDRQISEADARLVEFFRSARKVSVNREQLVRKELNHAASAGLKLSGAALTYATMREEATARREIYVRLMKQSEEASLAAGSRGSAINVIDYARQPVRAASPNLPVDMAMAVFVAFWMSLSAVLVREAYRKKRAPAVLMALVIVGLGIGQGQAPTPNTSGLPTGVARIPQTVEVKSAPNPKDAPVVWNTEGDHSRAGAAPLMSVSSQVMDQAQITAGDMLEVTEVHAPEVHTAVRVSREGTVVLPLAGEVKLAGLDEVAAGRAIETQLLAKGMLLHPQVTVLVTAYAGQDVSVLGEVVRPGIYSYTVHHRLLDLISAASGLSQNAGRLVTIAHRTDPGNSSAVVLDPSGSDAHGDHNPELMPGDTVQVGRAGLVYVVGDVIRPGGFPVDPVQATTVVQALSLAWGPSQNAALKKAVLIREQKGGRTVTTLNLKRMLRGLDPDLPVRDRDILFLPDSMAKNLLNRSMESVIQSAAGVSIYSGLVYSQRF